MQLSLFYDYERICRSSSFFQKFETLFLAVEAISDEKTLHKSTGRLGYGPICFLKALIYKNAQQIASIPELLRDLESRPLICDMIGFPFGKLPDSSNFYRFLTQSTEEPFSFFIPFLFYQKYQTNSSGNSSRKIKKPNSRNFPPSSRYFATVRCIEVSCGTA